MILVWVSDHNSFLVEEESLPVNYGRKVQAFCMSQLITYYKQNIDWTSKFLNLKKFVWYIQYFYRVTNCLKFISNARKMPSARKVGPLEDCHIDTALLRLRHLTQLIIFWREVHSKKKVDYKKNVSSLTAFPDDQGIWVGGRLKLTLL